MTRRPLGPRPHRHPARRHHSPPRVESLEDRRLLATFTVTGTGDSVGQFLPGATIAQEQVDDVASGDFDGDGSADLVFGLEPIIGSPTSTPGGVAVLLSEGGTFPGTPTRLALPNVFNVTAVEAGDFNGDGNTDIVFGTPDSTQTILNLILGNGDGTFNLSAIPTTRVDFFGNDTDFAAADFNGDNVSDLAIAGNIPGSPVVQFFAGSPGGTFTSFDQIQVVGMNTSPFSIAAADFDADRLPDLAVAGEFGTSGPRSVVQVIKNDGGVFSNTPEFEIDLGPSDAPIFGIGAGDFNGDGLADLAATADDSPSVSIALSTAIGSYLPVTTVTSRFQSLSRIALGDFDGSGFLGLATPGLSPGEISFGFTEVFFADATLRLAIATSNSTPGVDTIAFNIGGGGPHTITPLSALPTITDPVIIDGYTQGSRTADPSDDARPNTLEVGSNAVLLIELSGAGITSLSNGLAIAAGGSTVRGLVINRFTVNGIQLLEPNGGNTIEGNYIGTDVTGTVDLGNTLWGVYADNSSNSTIGGATPGARNVISGNGVDGVHVFNGTNYVVQGNYIGTDASGTRGLGNSQFGVAVFEASNSTIGGTTPGARNVISGNSQGGVGIRASTGILVQGNSVGTDAGGSLDLGNPQFGVLVRDASNSTIGGTTPGARNVISGNDGDGVLIDLGSSGILVQGNSIGTDATGAFNLGNSGIGVNIVSGSNNTIGGAAAGAGNSIAFNGIGVRVVDATGNAILTNSIHDHAGLGIDLGPAGVTPNDPADADVGGNNLQNAPVITEVRVVGGAGPFLSVGGFLAGARGTDYRIEFFGNPSLDGDGLAEGETFLGFIGVTTDASGNAPFTFLTSTSAGPFITATATDPTGNTSEFSLVPANLVITKVATPDPVTLGQDLTYLVSVTNNGPAPALGATLVDTLPAGVTFVSASRGAYDPATGRVVASLGDLAAGQSVTVTIVVTPTVAGTIFNTATAISRVFDATPADNTITVGTAVNPFPLDPLIVTNTLDAGLGSLRGAILAANARPGPDRIIFRIPGSGPFTIRPLSSLPAVTDPTVIDAASQPGFAGRPVVALDGTIAGAEVDGLTINAGNSTVRGFAIHSFGGSGVVLQGLGGNILVGNFIGLDLSGTVDRGNAYFGVQVDDVGGNVIGGTTPDLRNVISGNDQVGIRLAALGATGNRVQGNYIGTNAGGDAAVPNFQGILILGAPRNLIGGTDPGAGNVISGNDSAGIQILNDATVFDGQPVSNPPGVATGNIVQGNLIGTNAAGNAALGNFQGVFINDASGNLIGGTSREATNVISGNRSAGIQILGDNATGNIIQRNSIGTDRSGRLDLGNVVGVFIYAPPGNVIDRSRTGAGNNIAFNRPQDVRIRTLADGPTVADVTPLAQDGSSITGLTVTFSMYLDRARASDPGNYIVQRLVAGGRPSGRIPVVAAVYSEVFRTVQLTFATPIARGASFQLRIRGAAPAGLTDRRGNFLNGANRRAARGRGSDFVAVFGPGRRAGVARSGASQARGVAAVTAPPAQSLWGAAQPGRSLSPRGVDAILGSEGIGTRGR